MLRKAYNRPVKLLFNIYLIFICFLFGSLVKQNFFTFFVFLYLAKQEKLCYHVRIAEKT